MMRNGCQGKGVHVSVPRPRAMQATGGPVGSHHQAIEVVNCRFSNSIRRSSDVGARAQPTSSHQLLLTCRHPISWILCMWPTGLPLRLSWARRRVSPGTTGHDMLRLRPTRMSRIPPQNRYPAASIKCSEPVSETSSGTSQECS